MGDGSSLTRAEKTSLLAALVPINLFLRFKCVFEKI
jgi:hypothetical protein